MASFPSLVTFREDTPTYKFTIKNADGTAFDLSAAGSEVRFTGKRNVADTDANKIFSKLCSITDAVNGKCEVTLTQAETSPTPVTSAIADNDLILIVELEFKNGAGTVTTLGQTELTIRPDLFKGT